MRMNFNHNVFALLHQVQLTIELNDSSSGLIAANHKLTIIQIFDIKPERIDSTDM